MKCPKCGTENIDKAKFCLECATPLSTPVEIVTEEKINSTDQLEKEVLETNVEGSKRITNENKKNSKWNWILWWRVGEDELNRQIAEYYTLKITQSARGVSLLLLLLSSIFTIAVIVISKVDYFNVIDVIIFLGLGFFIYSGYKWAMISAMILWTIEKIFMFTSSPGASIIWWCIYMHAFYLAYRVEKDRNSRVKTDLLNMNLNN